MKLSIITYSFHKLEQAGMSDIFTYLETVRYRFGLDMADIWNGSLKSLDEDYLRKVKDGLDERGLTLANLAIDGAHIWEDDAATREQHHQKALANLRAAEILGARTVRLDSGGPRDKAEWTNEQFDAIVTRFREYAGRASDRGYRIGPENHWGPAMSPRSLSKLCQAINHPAFGVLLHFGRWHGADAERGDDIVAPWAMHTHISGQAIVSALRPKMDALRATGYTGVWGVEHVSMRYAELGLSVAAVRDVLDQWRMESGA
jgi:sugar phosphate isomerase/epimerase